MPKLHERITVLQERVKQLKAKQQRLEMRRRATESRRTRKEDTRRKILVGAVVLAKIERGEFSDSQLRGWLDEALTRADDRELFNLAVKPTSS